MKINDWLREAVIKIDEQDEIAKLEARLLIEFATDLSLTAQRCADVSFDGDTVRKLNALIARRAAGEPLAYIVGHQPFMDLDLHVNSSTLIPRGDSETLVQQALKVIANIKNANVIDLGCGSGALGLAIAKARRDCCVLLLDIEEQALAVARKNAICYQLDNAYFACGNWLDCCADNAYDVVLANPPYLAKNDAHLANLTFEPYRALVAGDNGFAALFHIIDHAPRVLRNGGYLLLEHGAKQARAVRDYCRANKNWQQITTHCDLAGNERVCCCQFVK